VSSVADVSSVTGGGQPAEAPNAMAELTSDEFLKVLITELANQDPLEPMKNGELMQQLAGIRSLESNNQMMAAFESMLSQQRLTQASSLIGKSVTGINSQGQKVSGTVERVSVAGDEVTLTVDGHSVSLDNVTDILGDSGANAGGLLP